MESIFEAGGFMKITRGIDCAGCFYACTNDLSSVICKAVEGTVLEMAPVGCFGAKATGTINDLRKGN